MQIKPNASLLFELTRIPRVGLRGKVSHKSKGVDRESRRATEALSFHNLRVTLLHEAVISQVTVQQWAAHDSEDVHSLYIKLGKEASQKVSDALPPLK